MFTFNSVLTVSQQKYFLNTHRAHKTIVGTRRFMLKKKYCFKPKKMNGDVIDDTGHICSEIH